MFKRILFLVFSIFISFNVNAETIDLNQESQNVIEKKVLDPKNTLYIELKDGIVVAELFPDLAPMHVQRIKKLASAGFYDNVKFHRVIDGFMAQTGDPTGTGRGGSKLGKLYAEFNKEHHTRGTLSMARASDLNSANSQFFIVTGIFFPELDGKYTIFGRVVEGMELVDKIKAGDTAKNGIVENPDVMIKVATGEMLNNKPLDVVKEEIAVVNEMQNEKLKEDSNYQKKSVLGILIETRDIDINQDDNANKEEQTATENKEQNDIDNNSMQNTTTENSEQNNTAENSAQNNTAENSAQNNITENTGLKIDMK